MGSRQVLLYLYALVGEIQNNVAISKEQIYGLHGNPRLPELTYANGCGSLAFLDQTRYDHYSLITLSFFTRLSSVNSIIC